MTAWAEMSKADREEVGRLERKAARLERKVHLDAFATKHELSCFKCGSSFNEWAKTGITNGRAWAICLPCVRSKKATPREKDAA